MIKSIGVEIEGAWNELPGVFFNDDNKFSHKVYRNDVSVKGLEELTCSVCTKNKRYCHCESQGFDSPDSLANSFKYVGEIASYPYFSINNLLVFIKDNYPIKTNASCGIHVHLKPDNIFEYQRLMSKKYYNDFRNAVEWWGISRNINPDSELFKRLKGKNRYCTKGFEAHKAGSDPSHYNMVNYCFGKHGTIELRLFPAFQSVKLTLDAVRFTYDFTNIWLISNKTLKSNKSKISRVIKLEDI